MMKTKYAFLFFFVLLVAHSMGADSFCKIEVKVTDQQQKPVDGVFAQLMKAKDSTMVKYSISDATGIISFDGVKAGTYLIFISQTGFENYFSSSVLVDSSHNLITLPDIALQSKILKEVVVQSNVPMIQRYADKTVVNVQQSILTAANNIFDIIQRSPGIQVDANDNISMVGKQGIMVMIDGKITPMSGSDLANYLRGLPADAVEKIEFITNPSAKYDANGTAGIINIILKKDKRVGTNATINLSYGQGVYPKANEGFSFNRRTKDFNLFMNYNYSYSENFHDAPRVRDFYNGNEFTGGYSETDYHTLVVHSNTARFGVDFFASKNTTIGFVADGSDRLFIASGNTRANVFDSLNNPLSYNLTNSNTNNNSYNYSGDLNMNHKFDSLGREISVNIDYSDFTTNAIQSFATNYYNLYGDIVTPPYLLYGNIPEQLNIYSFKADYDGQLGKHGMLGAGVKSSYVYTDNNLKFYDGVNSSAPIDTGQSNHFIYSENVDAAYVTYSRDMGKGNLQLGLRAEQTIARGDQVTTGQTFPINNFKLFPNIAFNDSVSNNSQVGISLTRRLDRPDYEQLNPYRNYVDPSTYQVGNPNLLPQYAYILQVSETYKQNYSISVNYMRTTGVISQVWIPLVGNEEPVIAETSQNLSSNDYAGISASAIFKFTKWWTSTDLADAYYTHYNGNYDNSGLDISKIFWDVNSDNLFILPHKWSIDVNGSYSSGWLDGYLSNDPNGNLIVGVQKKILKNKGVIKLNANDILYTSNFKGTAMFTGYIEHFNIQRDTRFVSISFSYHFGGTSQSRSMHTKGGDEEEKKRAGGTA